VRKIEPQTQIESKKQMPVFSEVLDLRSKDIKKLDPLPVGSYHATVAGLPVFEDVGKNQTPAAKFTMTGFVPLHDVDRAELAKCGDITKREITLTMFLTEASVWRLKKFLDDLGIEEGDMTLKQRIGEVQNRQCVVHIKHAMPKDTIFAEIDQTSKF
jgi:hypothetical protein